jgi:hypothetical protein
MQPTEQTTLHTCGEVLPPTHAASLSSASSRKGRAGARHSWAAGCRQHHQLLSAAAAAAAVAAAALTLLARRRNEHHQWQISGLLQSLPGYYHLSLPLGASVDWEAEASESSTPQQQPGRRKNGSIGDAGKACH